MRVCVCACVSVQKYGVSIHTLRVKYHILIQAHTLENSHIYDRCTILPTYDVTTFNSTPDCSFFMQLCEMSSCYKCIPSVIVCWSVSNHVPE